MKWPDNWNPIDHEWEKSLDEKYPLTKDSSLVLRSMLREMHYTKLERINFVNESFHDYQEDGEGG